MILLVQRTKQAYSYLIIVKNYAKNILYLTNSFFKLIYLRSKNRYSSYKSRLYQLPKCVRKDHSPRQLAEYIYYMD